MLSIFSDRVLQFDLKLRSLRRITCMDGIDSSVEGKPDVTSWTLYVINNNNTF